MGIIIRQSLKSSLVTFVSAGLGALVTVLLMYLLPKLDYGTYTLVVSYGTIISEIILFITPTVYFIYSKKYQKETRAREAGFDRFIIYPSLILFGIFQLGLIIFQVLVRPNIDLNPNGFFHFLDEHLILFSFLVTSLILFALLSSILEANQKNTLSAIAKNLVPRIFNLFVVFLLITKKINYEQSVLILLLQYSIGSLIALLMIFKFRLFPIAPAQKIDKEDASSIQLYRWSHIGFVLLYILSMQSIALIYSLVYKNETATYAVFNVAIFIASFMNIPLDQLIRSSLSTISQNMRESKWGELQYMYKRANLSLYHLATVMTIVLMFGLPLLIDITGHTKYILLLTIAPYFLIGKWVDVSTGFNTQLITASPKYLNIIWISAVSLVLLILFYAILIPKMGDEGVAAAMMLWMFFYNLIKVIYVKKEFGLSPFYGKVNLQALLLGLPFLILSLLSLHWSISPVILVILGALLAALYVSLVYKLGLSADLNSMIDRITNRNTRG